MSYNIYKYLEKYKYKENKGIEYFITKFNTKYLNGLIRSYYFEDDREEIIENINHIDLDEVIYNELEYEIDDDVKKYLIQIKENKLLNRVKEEIRKLNSSIDDLKSLYDNKGKQSSGPDLVNNLYQQYLLLYLHVNRNFIIQNVFTDYKEITSEMFSGLIQSYKTKEVGLKSFNAFIIIEAILNINTDELKRIVKEVNPLKIEENGINDVIEIVLNFLNSFYDDSSFAFDPIKNDSLSKARKPVPYTYGQPRYTTLDRINAAKVTSELIKGIVEEPLVLEEVGTNTLINPNNATIALSWKSKDDFDIAVAYEDKKGKMGLVFFNEKGSLTTFPFMQLDKDARGSMLFKQRETILINQLEEMKKVFIICWDYEAINAKKSANFSKKSNVQVAIEDENGFSSSAILQSDGDFNATCIAKIENNDGFVFTNVSKGFNSNFKPLDIIKSIEN